MRQAAGQGADERSGQAAGQAAGESQERQSQTRQSQQHHAPQHARPPRWRGGLVSLAVAAVVAVALALPFPALAQNNATWEGTIDNDYYNGGNWSTGTTPGGDTEGGPGSDDIATFNDSAAQRNINITGVDNRYIGGWTIHGGNYEITVVPTTATSSLEFEGAGITVRSGSVKLINNGATRFNKRSTAGDATITNNDSIRFYDQSSAGNAKITNNADRFLNDEVSFFNQSTAGNATITNNTGSQVLFVGDSSAENASISNAVGGIVRFGSGTALTSGRATAGNAKITNNGLLLFRALGSGGQARITN
ncbi:MAG: hypothetical protein AAF471_08885, partial [Myxococcota bacterium]